MELLRVEAERGVLLSLENRFVARVLLEGEEECHVPDTGSLLRNARRGTEVFVRRRRGLGRRTSCDVVAAKLQEIVGVDSRLPNALFAELVRREIGGLRGELVEEALIRGAGMSYRADFLLLSPGESPIIAEVKGVNFVDERGIALFPNAVSERAARQLDELVRMTQEGFRALLAFVIMRGDAKEVRPYYAMDRSFSSRLCAYRDRIVYKAFGTRLEEREGALHFSFAGELEVKPCLA
ncbi:MAG: DNA/RNA nuclease SfsA [Acidilobaceae archaeon]|nr:DNA/RNA nuclease SfsA [Acidilobaceae archaeon]MCX8165475.1 DNA/RNA nuclease SfsA [Acidilobaceae archaeon]MDW7973902.1 DNA/RNA nuclease SfsA [Sulfolobales archaeon]